MESLAFPVLNNLNTFRQSMEEILFYQQEKMKELCEKIDQIDKLILNTTEDLIREYAKRNIHVLLHFK